jgi:ribosome-associated toxin RatA of RatAB toxin-antitoxin module
MRPRHTWLACLAIGLLRPASAAPTDDALNVTVTRNSAVLQVRAELKAAVAVATCYATLADFDHLEEFIPNLTTSDVVSGPGEPIRLHQVGEASAGFFSVTLDVTLAVRERPPEHIEFERVAGNLRQMTGSWNVAGDEHHCDIAYRADIEPAFWVPPLIGPALMRRQVRDQLEGLHEELKRRAGVAPAP